MPEAQAAWLAVDAVVIVVAVRQFVSSRKSWHRLEKKRADILAQAQYLSSQYTHDPSVRYTVYCGWTVECEHYSCTPDPFALAPMCPTYDDAVQLRDRHAGDPAKYRLIGRKANG